MYIVWEDLTDSNQQDAQAVYRATVNFVDVFWTIKKDGVWHYLGKDMQWPDDLFPLRADDADQAKARSLALYRMHYHK